MITGYWKRESSEGLRAWQRWSLNIGAALGTLCLLLALVTVAFGIKPLIFSSGSMGPAIPTGSLGIAIPTEVSSIEAGQIVSVVTTEGTRVTHRVVANTQSGLILKGDANPVEDLQPYAVEKADRLLFAVPVLGYVIIWFSQPWAFFVGGLLCAYLLYLAFGRHDRPTKSEPEGTKDAVKSHVQKRKTPRKVDRAMDLFTRAICVVLVVSTVLLGVATLGKAENTQAAFSGSASATASQLKAGTLGSVPSSLTCKTVSVIAGLVTRADVSWEAPNLPAGSRAVVRIEMSNNTVRYLSPTPGTNKVVFSPSLSLLGSLFGSAQIFTIRVLVVTSKNGLSIDENGTNIGWSSPLASAPSTSIQYNPGILIADSYSCVKN